MSSDMNDVARRNSEARQHVVAAAIAGDLSGLLARFQQLVDTSVFSTNVDDQKVLSFDAAGDVLDARSLHAAGVGDPSADAWWARREAFEDLWEHGRRFVYGAVNAGGMGIEEFGAICLVVRDPRNPPPEALAVFPGDTAQRYTDEAVTVDRTRAEAEATAWEDRSLLAVTERHTEVGDDDEAWPDVVCALNRYFEVTRAGQLPLSAVGEVRLRASYRVELIELRALARAGDPLTPSERRQADAYEALRAWWRTFGIPIVAIP